MFTIVVDPARLVDTEWLRAEIDSTIAYVKSTPSLVHERPILVAGEAERLTEASRRAAGIEINDEAWEEMQNAAARLD